MHEFLLFLPEPSRWARALIIVASIYLNDLWPAAPEARPEYVTVFIFLIEAASGKMQGAEGTLSWAAAWPTAVNLVLPFLKGFLREGKPERALGCWVSY